jgi:predicted nucleotidyltransferase
LRDPEEIERRRKREALESFATGPGDKIVNEKDMRIANELKKRLSEQVRLVSMKVFGSRARGDATDDSDMDVFIEVESLDRNVKERILDTAWEVSLENLVVISPLIFSGDELRNSPMRSAMIVKNIQNDGCLI